MTCDLCVLKKKTKWYFENKDFAIIDCETCHIPMVVWKHHGIKPDKKKVQEMQEKAKEIFGENITFRMLMRKIPEHYHFHISV